MHDLGQYHLQTGRWPTTRTAERFAAARIAALPGVNPIYMASIAAQAIRDWRTTQRVKAASDRETLRSLMPRGSGRMVVGVRVTLDLVFPNGKPLGARQTTTVLVNVSSDATIDEALQIAMAVWNEGEASTRHGNRSGGVATNGKITQVVEGGFSHILHGSQ